MQLIESRYAPGLRQPSHVHATALVAMVVAGDVAEERDGHARSRGSPGEIVVVPRGAAHDVAFGARGAKLLTVRADQN